MLVNSYYCGKLIDTDKRDYWNLPGPRGGIVSAHRWCYPPQQVDPPAGAYLIDKDGNEYPIEVKGNDNVRLNS